MKSHLFNTPLVLTILALVVSGCATAAGSAHNSEADSEDTLYILLERSDGGLSIDEKYHFARALEDVFKEKEFDGPFIIRRQARGAAPSDARRLSITIVEWRQNIPERIDCRIAATLYIDGDPHELGIARGEELGTAGVIRINELFREAAAKAIRALYPRLAEHLPEASS